MTVIQDIRKKAICGNIEAQMTLGKAYQEGKIVQKDMMESLYWYVQAGKKGDTSAISHIQEFSTVYPISPAQALAVLWADGQTEALRALEAIGGQQNWNAVLILKEVAVRGDKDAQFFVGMIHAYGKGVIRNIPEAISWFYKAAKQNHKNAAKELYTLALKQHSMANVFLAKLAHKRKVEAMYWISLYWLRMQQLWHKPDIVFYLRCNSCGTHWKSKLLFTMLCELQYAVPEQGMILLEDNISFINTSKIKEFLQDIFPILGVIKADKTVLQTLREKIEENSTDDTKKNVYLRTALALTGDSTAIYHMGLQFLEGKGLTKDETLGIQWIRRASQAGYIPATMTLATCFEKGIGTNVNLEKAQLLREEIQRLQ